MDIQQKYFVQYMIKNGTVPVQKALAICQKIPQGSIQDLVQLKYSIIVINREISKQYFKIANTTCEVTGQDLFIWANTKNDNISKLQITFKAIELEYFHAILQEILNSEDYRLKYIVVVNITSTLTASFTRVNGQTLLTKWIKSGYFIKNGEYVHLGPRLILEFTSYLMTHRPDQTCKLCSELVFTGKKCGSCGRLLHTHCLQKYLTNQSTCPVCKELWQDVPNETLMPHTQNNVNEEDTDDQYDESSEESTPMDSQYDEPIAGPSQGKGSRRII
ncbi:unnamed protein product [Ceutorhynchus assimilis]|uniref:Non-structural maintenance of chromosomes element 1 homolog n=1 Tax=Ceutorhynchus assimilis TaxID=467358 RepID=A0A9N9MHX4_9CUCU|nr:unnamed protein product [Ceutorhynchus assimilis]